MLREGVLLGVIVIRRTEARLFTDKRIVLLQTFADQAVIAIENVRLFKELEARTQQLTRSVDKLTALGEVSRALSSTLDLEAVLQTIVSRASQLAGADGCVIYEYEEGSEEFRMRASYNFDAASKPSGRGRCAREKGQMGRAVETREPMQVADIAAYGALRRAAPPGGGPEAPARCLRSQGTVTTSLALIVRDRHRRLPDTRVARCIAARDVDGIHTTVAPAGALGT